MDVQIQLVGELNDATMAQVLTVLAGGNGGSAPKVVAPKTAATKQAVEVAEEAEEAQEEKTGKTASKAPAPKAGAPKPAAKVEEEDFSELDEEGQLEAIKKEVTKYTKKGKASDIKQLLGLYDVQKASDLDPATYEEFYELVKRYSAGESAEDIVESFAV